MKITTTTVAATIKSFALVKFKIIPAKCLNLNLSQKINK